MIVHGIEVKGLKQHMVLCPGCKPEFAASEDEARTVAEEMTADTGSHATVYRVEMTPVYRS